MASAAAAANGEMPAEEGGGLSLRPVADRLLLACCRAIKKQTGWQHRTLRAACDWATGELARNQHPGLGLSRYYRVVELGMESNSEDVVEEALGQLHKLIAGGLVRRDTMTTLKDGSSANLADILVDMVLLTGSKDKTVRRGGRAQAVKCLLSCVTSPEIQIHGEQLRRVYSFVRETFLIIDSTANRARHNKAQARATLDHILQVTFSRLEMEESLPQSFQGHPSPQARAIEVLLSPQSAKTPTVLPSAAVAAVAAVAESLEKEGSTYSQLGAEGSVPPTGSSAAGSEGVPPVATAVHDVLGKIEEGSVSDGANSDNVSLGGGEAGGGEERVGKTTVATEVGVEGEMQLDEERAEGGIREEESGGAGSAPTVAQSDALMLLTDLCNWSLADERSVGGDESVGRLLESKTMALELIVAVLRTYGGARFRALPAAILLVRGELCPALLHHCTSGVTEMVSLSLRVFVALVKGFKNHLKAEVEVFITSIFLRILESEHSAFDHKMLVLEAISGLCRDPVALVEMFVNYDCDLEAIDLFKRIMTALTKVAKGRSMTAEAAGKKELEEERSLQLRGMAGTVDVVASMVKAADLEELEGEMAMAPRLDPRRVHTNSIISEVAPSLSPVRAISTTPVGIPAISSSSSPRRNCDIATATSSSKATHMNPTHGTQAQGVTTATAPGDQSGGGPADARASTSALLSNTWSGGPAPASSGVDARRSRRGFSFALGVGVGGGGDEVARGRPVSGRGRRGSLRVDGQTQGEALQAFDTKRRVQREIEAGIIKFNQKPKEGLAYLHSKGHLNSSEPASVASFLREQSQRLDKTEVGEFLGRGADYMGGFCVKVLHAYVDGMDFTDMLFDEAIRHFLSGFRLPGEAQKIDRMMEKFAERFCLQNASVFPNPDTAFILAFSIVMLNTDLHNPSIPDAKRMTKEGFIKNNRGIDQGESLPDEFLGGVYDRIARSPISLKEDDQLRRVVEGGSSATYSLQEMLPFSGASSARRLAAHDREREEMLKSSRALLRRQRGPPSSTNRYTLLSMAGGDDVLVSPDIVDHVWLMYEITWGPLLAVFSEVLESSDDSELIEQCLEGLKKAVRIAGGLDMTMARETLINALVRFTLLETSKHMEDKNVRCVKVLLCLALTDGNLLRESWGPVLRCISQLSRLQLFARDLQQDGLSLGVNDAEPPPRKVKDSAWKPGGAGAEIGINGSGGSGKLPAAIMVPNPAEGGEVAREAEVGLGERNTGGAGDEGSAVAMGEITAEEKEGRDDGDGGGDEEEYATEDSPTTTTTTVTTSSTDWLSDLKSALGVTSAGRGGGATKGPGGEIVGSGSGGAMEQVMSYFKERDALLNDRRRREREKAMGELATFFMGPSREEKARMVEERNAAAVMGQIDQALIDRVFSATRMLNREAMQHFVEQLIQVSRSEIPQLFGRRSGALGGYQRHEGGAKGGSSTGGGGTATAASKPRVFSMQKLVEIAHLNMDVRSRIEWAGLWGALAEHLGTVGSMSGGTSVAMYTVDCLRQLALKFLDKDELRDFNFQRIFLGPFATIFRNSREAAIRELVVSCLNVVILTKGPLIRSGWKTVLSVLRAAARDTEEDVVQPASSMLARLSGEQFPLVQYDFVDLVHALLEMAASRFLDVSLECMGHLWSCARELGEGRVDVALQRPLLEATVSNTGQLPREVLDAAIADRGEAGAGAGAGAAVARVGDRKRRAFDHLTLDVDALEETAGSGSAGSLKTASGNDGNHDSALPAPREKHSSTVASGDSVTGRVSQRSGESAMTSTVAPAAGSFGSARLALRLWWPLLTGLARRVGDPRLDCRAAALSTLRDILREYGSAPEFSVRVWPFILTHVLLPASRHARRIFPLSVPPEVPPEMPPMATPSTSSTPSIQDRASPAAAPSTSPRNVGSGSKHQPPPSPSPSLSATVFLCPASRSVLPLDVRSWMHTTAPQLFRAAAIVVAGNAKGAVPLGLPTLMAFLEPHVCCRRGSGRGRPDRRRRLSWPPFAADVDRDEAENENAHRKKRRESQPEKRTAAAVAGAGWAGEVEAAAAAGALLAEEAGVTGTGLMSRIALESLGLLVEGLVGQQVPQDVLSFMFDSLVRMMRRCLPGLISEHSVYGTRIPTLPSPAPRSKNAGEAGGPDGAVSGAKCGGGGGDANACRESDAVGAREMDSLDDADGGGGGEGGGRNSDGDWAVSRGKESGRGEADDGLAGSSALGFSAVKVETSQGTGNSKGTRGFANIGSVSFSAPVASAPGCDHLILDDDAESVREMRSEAVDTFLCPTSEAQPPDGGSSRDKEDVGVDGERAALLLSAALRLERLMYGLARLHLRALGEDGARVLLGGLSEGVRYARAFHSQHALRMSLFSDGILMPRSGPRSCELPHVLELESEGVCYIFAVAFRLLGVRWPRSSPPSAIANNSAGGDGVFDSGQSTTIGWTSLWPNRHAFEPPPSARGGVVGGAQQQRQQRQIRPPRAGPDFGSRETEASVRAPYNVPTYHRTPTLVVDDLLDWGGEGDTGPRDGNDAAGEAAGSSSDRGSTRGPSWDGTALSREFLRNEGSALLKRYFVADGGLQRGRLEDGAWAVDDEAPVSPVSISSISSSRPASETARSTPGGAKRGEFGLDFSAPGIPPGGEGGRGKVRQEKSAGNMAPQAPRIPSSHRPVHAATSSTGYRSEAVDLVATWDLEVRRLTPAVLLLLRGLLLLELPEEFAWQASWVYPCLADLVVVRSLEVRAAVRELLLRLAPLLSLSDR